MANHFFNGPYPDICLGIEPNYYDKEILMVIEGVFRKNDYSIRIDYPYSGSFVPNIIYKNAIKVKGFTSIMIEINKKIYDEKAKFNKLREAIKEIISSLDGLK